MEPPKALIRGTLNIAYKGSEKDIQREATVAEIADYVKY
jgi:hypothetical protein